MKPAELDTLNDKAYNRRLLAVVVLGVCVALVLTWFMHRLIYSSEQRLDESERAHLVDFVRLKRDETSSRKDRKPEKLLTEEAPPTPAAPPADASDAQNTLAVSDLFPNGLDAGINIGGLGFDASEGEYLPIVKVAPIYPHRAASTGLEGECVVVYTVTTTGATRDVRVVESMCTDRIFYSASIAAATRFKYKPRVIDGQPVEVHDVTNRFIYQIQDDLAR